MEDQLPQQGKFFLIHQEGPNRIQHLLALAGPLADLDEAWTAAVPQELHYNNWIVHKAPYYLIYTKSGRAICLNIVNQIFSRFDLRQMAVESRVFSFSIAKLFV